MAPPESLGFRAEGRGCKSRPQGEGVCEGGGSKYFSRAELPGESNVHQIVVTVLCRLRPAFPEGKCAASRYRNPPCFSGNSYYVYRTSPVPHQESNRGQNVTRIGGPQSCVCPILSKNFPPNRGVEAIVGIRQKGLEET